MLWKTLPMLRKTLQEYGLLILVLSVLVDHLWERLGSVDDLPESVL
jgi:hypothetical protein